MELPLKKNKQSDKFVENKPNDVTIERVYEKERKRENYKSYI